MRVVLFALLLCIIPGYTPQHNDLREKVKLEIVKGNFTKASQLIDAIVISPEISENEKMKLLFTKDSLHRVCLDFRRTKADILSQFEAGYGFTPGDSLLSQWEQSKVLEYRVIDGKKRYFRNAVPNVFRVDATAKKMNKKPAPASDTPSDSLLVDAFNHKRVTGIPGKYLLPKKSMSVRYTLTVGSEAVEDGRTVKAWLPFPRQDIGRQTAVKLLASSPSHHTLSGNETAHSSIYMEQDAMKENPTIFTVEFEFASRGEWFNLSEIEVKPYNKNSKLYKRYTAERPPHIQFSNNIKALTDSITANAQTPVETLQDIYRYIVANYPWASAIEYSTIPNIPEYVIENRKGDCGQVALLLITMLRYKGIPARWQSGWMMHPDEVNLHDWAEVYFEGTGWVPCDVSFGRGEEIPIDPGREFFMSGIDSYRLYLNSDFSDSFSPAKKYPRSENVDFQRGEVETDDWNLYFDRWRYKMEVSYLSSDRLGDETLGVICNSVGTLRAEPNYRAELVTQALLGTPVRILEKKGSWSRVQTPDSYTGWMNGSVQEMTKTKWHHYMKKTKVMITSLYARSFEQGDEQSQPVSDLVIGNMLELLGEHGAYYRVRYPDGREAYVSQADAEVVTDKWIKSELTGESIVTLAHQFMGIPYLWGGTSSKGLDCSGFTKTIYFLHGVIIPRDASQQAQVGKLIDQTGDFSQLQPGDLLFFGEKATEQHPRERVVHVAIYIGNKRFIHAGNPIRVNSLEPSDELYDAYNAARYLRAKRIIGEVGTEGIDTVFENELYNIY